MASAASRSRPETQSHLQPLDSKPRRLFSSLILPFTLLLGSVPIPRSDAASPSRVCPPRLPFRVAAVFVLAKRIVLSSTSSDMQNSPPKFHTPDMGLYVSRERLTLAQPSGQRPPS